MAIPPVIDSSKIKPVEQESFDEEFEEFEEEKPAKDTLKKPGGGGGR